MENNNLNQQNEQVTQPIVTEPVVAAPVVAEPAAQPVVVQQPAAQPVVYAQQPVVYAQQPVAQQGQVVKPSRGKGLAFSIVSLSLGIFGFIFAILTFFMALAGFATAEYAYDMSELAPIIAIVIVYGLIVVGVSIPALILGAKGKKLIGSKMGSTGVVFSIINFVLIGLCVLMLFAMSAMVY